MMGVNSLYFSFHNYFQFIIDRVLYTYRFFYYELDKVNCPLILKTNNFFHAYQNDCQFNLDGNCICGEIEGYWGLLGRIYTCYKSKDCILIKVVLPEGQRLNVWVEKKRFESKIERVTLANRVITKLNPNMGQTGLEKMARKVTDVMLNPFSGTQHIGYQLNGHKQHITVNPRHREMIVHSRDSRDEVGKGAFKTVFKSPKWVMEGSNDQKHFVADQFIKGSLNVDIGKKEDRDLFLIKQKADSEQIIQSNRYSFSFMEGSQPCFVATTFLYKTDLAKRLKNESPPLSDYQKLSILKDVSQGLKCLHRIGKVHRDIKPDNIFIHPDKKGMLRGYVGDLGLMTNQGIDTGIAGTREYWAPEARVAIVRSETSIDMWAMGCLIYEMFVKLGGKISDDEGERFKEWDRKDLFAAKIESLINRCLKILPRHRISIDQLIHEIDQLLLDLSVTNQEIIA